MGVDIESYVTTPMLSPAARGEAKSEFACAIIAIFASRYPLRRSKVHSTENLCLTISAS